MIEGITIEQLQAVTGGRHSAYRGVLLAERVAADRPAQLFEEPLRIEATTFWLCTKGRSRVICSLRTYEVEEGSLLMIPPKSIISTESGGEACEGIALMCDSNYLSMCNINIKKMTSAMMCIVQHPCVKLTGAELARLRSALALLKDRIDDRAASEFHDDLIRSLVETITYLCCDLFMAHIAAEQPEPAKSGVSVRLDEYFHRFLHAVRHRHAVVVLAGCLCQIIGRHSPPADRRRDRDDMLRQIEGIKQHLIIFLILEHPHDIDDPSAGKIKPYALGKPSRGILIVCAVRDKKRFLRDHVESAPPSG